MIGIVGGGFLGLAIGYWLLNYFGGPRYDFLQIPLPGVSHTQHVAEAPQPEIPPAKAEPASVVESPVSPPQTTTTIETPSPPAQLSSIPAPPVRSPQAFPTFTSDELGQALAKTNGAIGCEACQSTGFVKRVVVIGATEVGGRRIENKAEKRVPCEACHGKPSGKITAEVYRQLCHLAQVITFVEIAPDDPHLFHRKEAVEQVLLKAAADRDRQAAVGRLAGYWLGGKRDSDGVLLAGTIQETGQSGKYHWARVVLFGLPETAVVVSPGRGPFLPQDRVLIAGSIVQNPRERLPGYEGSEPQVVWGGLPIKLPAER
jgi:hypothetical protein